MHGLLNYVLAGARVSFRNCRHMREPGCAVVAALQAGSVDPLRYDSYRRIVISVETGAE
jgi:ribosome biogenesis GTPase